MHFKGYNTVLEGVVHGIFVNSRDSFATFVIAASVLVSPIVEQLTLP